MQFNYLRYLWVSFPENRTKITENSSLRYTLRTIKKFYNYESMIITFKSETLFKWVLKTDRLAQDLV